MSERRFQFLRAAAFGLFALTAIVPGAAVAQSRSQVANEVAAGSNAQSGTEQRQLWHVSLTVDANHTIDRSQPQLTNTLSFDPTLTIPVKLHGGREPVLGMHLGFNNIHQYARRTPIGTPNRPWNRFDLDVSTLLFVLPVFTFPQYGISMQSTFIAFVPYTSVLVGQRNDWMFSYEGSLGFNYRVAKGGHSVIFSTGAAFRQNFHRFSWVFLDVPGGDGYNLIRFRVFNRFNIVYSFKGLSITALAGIIQGWVYQDELREQRLIFNLYSFDVTYSLAATGVPELAPFSLSAGFNTFGQQRRNGGFKNDWTYPLDPRSTQVYFAINYYY